MNLEDPSNVKITVGVRITAGSSEGLVVVTKSSVVKVVGVVGGVSPEGDCCGKSGGPGDGVGWLLFSGVDAGDGRG